MDEMQADGMPGTKRTKPERKSATPRVKRPPQPKPDPVMRHPDVLHPDIDQWLIMGLDPSLSRTGYAFMLVKKTEDGTSAQWLAVGSLKPDDASAPVWVRSKAIALALRGLLKEHIEACKRHPEAPGPYRTGLIISFEAPTPNNDFLSSINRILHLTLLDRDTHDGRFPRIFVQQTNASTLRSLMGLTKTGASNKTENVAKAYGFLDQAIALAAPLSLRPDSHLADLPILRSRSQVDLVRRPSLCARGIQPHKDGNECEIASDYARDVRRALPLSARVLKHVHFFACGTTDNHAACNHLASFLLILRAAPLQRVSLSTRRTQVREGSCGIAYASHTPHSRGPPLTL